MAKRKGGFKVKGTSAMKEHKAKRKSHKARGRKRSHKK